MLWVFSYLSFRLELSLRCGPVSDNRHRALRRGGNERCAYGAGWSGWALYSPRSPKARDRGHLQRGLEQSSRPGPPAIHDAPNGFNCLQAKLSFFDFLLDGVGTGFGFEKGVGWGSRSPGYRVFARSSGRLSPGRVSLHRSAKYDFRTVNAVSESAGSSRSAFAK